MMGSEPLSAPDGAPAPDDGQGSGIGTYHVIKTSNVDELEDNLSNLAVSQKLVPLRRESLLESEFRFDGLRGLGSFQVRFGRSLGVEVPQDESDNRLNNIFFVMSKEGTGQLLLAREKFAIAGQHGVVFTSGLPRSLHFMKDCAVQVFTMDRRKVAECCAKLLGQDVEEGNLKFEVMFPLDDAGGQSWLRLLDYALNELSHPSSLIRSSPAAGHQLEQMLMTGLLLGHSHRYSEALLRPQSAAAPYYVKRAEAYIEHHFADPLSLADIAAHAAVSARSLQNGFRNFRNMTPMEFLRRIRLKNAHAYLMVAEPGIATTTDIAMRSGFTHMGEFAALYKRTYGVAPSQTLLKMASR